MGDVVNLTPPGPPMYDPRADRRDEMAAEGIDIPPRTTTEEAIYRDWVRKDRPDDYDLGAN